MNQKYKFNKYSLIKPTWIDEMMREETDKVDERPEETCIVKERCENSVDPIRHNSVNCASELEDDDQYQSDCDENSLFNDSYKGKWCVCEQSDKPHSDTKMCDQCTQWYHLSCLSYSSDEVNSFIKNRRTNETFLCPVCKEDQVFIKRYESQILLRKKKFSAEELDDFSDVSDSNEEDELIFNNNNNNNYNISQKTPVLQLAALPNQPKKISTEKTDSLKSTISKTSSLTTTAASAKNDTAKKEALKKSTDTVLVKSKTDTNHPVTEAVKQTANTSKNPVNRKNLHCIQCKKPVSENSHSVPEDIEKNEKYNKNPQLLAKNWLDTIYCNEKCIRSHLEANVSRQLETLRRVDLLDSKTKKQIQQLLKEVGFAPAHHINKLYDFVVVNPKYFVVTENYRKKYPLSDTIETHQINQRKQTQVISQPVKQTQLISQPPKQTHTTAQSSKQVKAVNKQPILSKQTPTTATASVLSSHASVMPCSSKILMDSDQLNSKAKSIELLVKQLKKRYDDTSDEMKKANNITACNIEAKAKEIEAAIHTICSSDAKKYNTRLKRIVLNLGDKSNNTFYLKVLSGKLSAEKIANMESNEMADDKLAEARSKEKQDEIEMIIKHNDEVNEAKMKRPIKMTHKGEVFAGDEVYYGDSDKIADQKNNEQSSISITPRYSDEFDANLGENYFRKRSDEFTSLSKTKTVLSPSTPTSSTLTTTFTSTVSPTSAAPAAPAPAPAPAPAVSSISKIVITSKSSISADLAKKNHQQADQAKNITISNEISSSIQDPIKNIASSSDASLTKLEEAISNSNKTSILPPARISSVSNSTESVLKKNPLMVKRTHSNSDHSSALNSNNPNNLNSLNEANSRSNLPEINIEIPSNLTSTTNQPSANVLNIDSNPNPNPNSNPNLNANASNEIVQFWKGGLHTHDKKIISMHANMIQRADAVSMNQLTKQVLKASLPEEFEFLREFRNQMSFNKSYSFWHYLDLIKLHCGAEFCFFTLNSNGSPTGTKIMVPHKSEPVPFADDDAYAILFEYLLFNIISYKIPAQLQKYASHFYILSMRNKDQIEPDEKLLKTHSILVPRNQNQIIGVLIDYESKRKFNLQLDFTTYVPPVHPNGSPSINNISPTSSSNNNEDLAKKRKMKDAVPELELKKAKSVPPSTSASASTSTSSVHVVNNEPPAAVVDASFRGVKDPRLMNKAASSASLQQQRTQISPVSSANSLDTNINTLIENIPVMLKNMNGSEAGTLIMKILNENELNQTQKERIYEHLKNYQEKASQIASQASSHIESTEEKSSYDIIIYYLDQLSSVSDVVKNELLKTCENAVNKRVGTTLELTDLQKKRLKEKYASAYGEFIKHVLSLNENENENEDVEILPPPEKWQGEDRESFEELLSLHRKQNASNNRNFADWSFENKNWVLNKNHFKHIHNPYPNEESK